MARAGFPAVGPPQPKSPDREIAAVQTLLAEVVVERKVVTQDALPPAYRPERDGSPNPGPPEL